MATLHLHATADAVEHEWRQALAAGGIVELGLGRATSRELVEAAATAIAPAATADKLRLGPIGERLVVDVVAEGAGGALASIAQSRGLRKSLQKTFGALGRVGVGPGELQRAALDAGGMAGAHAREIAARLAAYEKHLSAGGLVDEAALWRAGCRAIGSGAAVPMLADVDVVETHDVVEWDGAMLLLLDALLERGLAVRVIVPAAETLPPSAAAGARAALGRARGAARGASARARGASARANARDRLHVGADAVGGGAARRRARARSGRRGRGAGDDRGVRGDAGAARASRGGAGALRRAGGAAAAAERGGCAAGAHRARAVRARRR